jgi:multiple sugar transport system permease protein
VSKSFPGTVKAVDGAAVDARHLRAADPRLIASAQMMIQPILFGASLGFGGSPFFQVPANGANLVPAHIFDVTFIAAAPGLGAALSWLLFLIMLLVTLLLFATGRFWVFYGSD